MNGPLRIMLMGALVALAPGCGGGHDLASTTSFTLTLKPGPNGKLAAQPPGPTYPSGTVVTLSAAPDPGYVLQAWSGSDDDALGAAANTVTMRSDRTVSATFAPPADCLVDPVSGNAVARMISPQDGATLPSGAVTFQWCNAGADYFLEIGTAPGSHEIFFAFAGGPGAGVESLTLGPGCAPAAPTGCIPARGETVYVKLWTIKRGNSIAPSPFNYTYKAAAQ